MPISNEDRDMIHILPLSMIPLEAPVFQHTRMIKNSQLESVVEIYKGEDTGSGQVPVGQLRTVYRDIGFEDVSILQKLAGLHSYDVYSLRRLLRDLEIDVDDEESLKLSDEKQHELNSYMHLFTRPLILQLYGKDKVEVKSGAQILDLFQKSDSKDVLKNIKMFAQMLQIQVDEIPGFLADYGDLYMSISYYRQCLENIGPIFQEFNAIIEEIQSNRQLQQNKALIDSCTHVQTKLRRMAMTVMTRFRDFDNASKSMWGEVNPNSFNGLGNSIRSSQTALGGVLCALSVKMNAWSSRFPHRQVGGPMKWADFISTDMRQGLEAF